MPTELSMALTVDSLASRYGAAPADVLRWDSENLKIAGIVAHYQDNQPKQAEPKAEPKGRMTLKERQREASIG